MNIRVVHICTIPLSLRLLLADQMRYLEDQGYEVHMMSGPGQTGEDPTDLGFPWHPIRITRGMTPAQDLLSVWDVARHCQREQFTIVHTHTAKAILLGQLGGHLARVPIVGQTIHGFYFGGLPPSKKRTLIRAMEVFACRNADFVLSQSAEDVDLILREKLCAPEKVSTLGNGINIDRFVPPAMSHEELLKRRAAIGLKRGGPVIGIVGRYVVEKGYRELCDAVEALIPEFPDLEVLCVGTHPDDERSHEVVRPEQHPRVGDRFVCLYNRSDMPDLYALMDIFTLPSYREGFPRSCMEASAVGVPVVTTDIRGCREAVHHEDNGVLVPAKDSDALAQALRTLLHSPELRAQYGQQGRVHAVERFDQRIVFDRVVRLYERELRARSLPLPS